MRKYVWLILLLAIVALAGIGGALAMSITVLGDFEYEEQWVRALLEVGLIALLGVVAVAVLDRFKDTLQQRDAAGNLKLDVLNGLSRAYMDVKLVRRKIQAGGQLADPQTDRLNEIQVLVELHMHDNAQLFRRTGELQGHLRTMEQYLDKVANEPASQERRGFAGAGFEVFSDAYESAAQLIRPEIAGR
jgi:hypothetical protein